MSGAIDGVSCLLVPAKIERGQRRTTNQSCPPSFVVDILQSFGTRQFYIGSTDCKHIIMLR